MAVTEADWEWIDLIPRRVEFCREWALKRRTNAIDSGWTPRNRATGGLAGLSDDDLGMMGEAAGMLYFTRAINAPVTWHYYKRDGNVKDLPDIEDFIDIKSVHLNSYRLPVQDTQPKEWAYVLALCELAPRIALAGWCWGHEAKQQNYWGDPARINAPAYWISPRYAFFKPMRELALELKRRRTV